MCIRDRLERWCARGMREEDAERYEKCLARILSGEMLEAVSYTHLDVYKRQSRARAPQRAGTGHGIWCNVSAE